MRLGFACAWDDPPEKTWSYTPWHLQAALARQCALVDAGIELTPFQRKLLDALHYRFQNGRLSSYYGPSRLRDLVNHLVIQQAFREKPFDVLLQMDDLAIPRMPFYLYQDMSYAALIHWLNDGHALFGFTHLNLDIIARRADRQQQVYSRAEGLFTMSRWLGDQIRTLAGVPQRKIHTVYSGSNVIDASCHRPMRAGPLRKKLLFLGRDFYRKGGDLVVQATALLRREQDPQIELSVAGPEHWPLPGGIPTGVQFLGKLAPSQMPALFAAHDLLVLPSRFEPFGIAFVEALAAGLPCIGRNDFAMPEIIQNGTNGALLQHDDAYALAEIILHTLQNDFVYAQTARAVMQVRQFFSWDRVAADMLQQMGPCL
jgi:glycosyltransferase involved in cell wall biosynthesis